METNPPLAAAQACHPPLSPGRPGRHPRHLRRHGISRPADRPRLRGPRTLRRLLDQLLHGCRTRIDFRLRTRRQGEGVCDGLRVSRNGRSASKRECCPAWWRAGCGAISPGPTTRRAASMCAGLSPRRARRIPFTPPDIPHLHFNIRPEARSVAVTRAMVDMFLKYLTEHGEKQVYGQVVAYESRRGERHVRALRLSRH